jgi:hypothetical protein
MDAPRVHMNVTLVYSGLCVISTIAQGYAAFLYIREKHAGANMDSKPPFPKSAGILILGAIVTAVIGFLLAVFPPQPKVVTQTITVEKPAPACPPAEQKTDHVTTRGNNSGVTTGNGNKFEVGATPKPQQ